MDLDLQELTLGDLEEVEEISGVRSEEIFSGQMPPIKALKAIVYVVRRRDDPDFTLEDAAAVKVTALGDLGADEDPTDAAD